MLYFGWQLGPKIILIFNLPLPLCQIRRAPLITHFSVSNIHRLTNLYSLPTVRNPFHPCLLVSWRFPKLLTPSLVTAPYTIPAICIEFPHSECLPRKLAYTCSSQGTVRCITKHPVKNTPWNLMQESFTIIFVLRPVKIVDQYLAKGLNYEAPVYAIFSILFLRDVVQSSLYWNWLFFVN